MSALTDARDAIAAQADAVIAWADGLTDAELAVPSSLEAWSVRDVLGHLVVSVGRLTDLPASPSSEDPIPLHRYVRAYRPLAADIEAQAKGVEGDPRPALKAARAAGLAAIDGGIPAVVQAMRGPMRDVDALLTRAIELVTHSVDLGAPLDRGALELVVRTFAQMLADTAPGRSVELRIPPFAAVQIVEGQTHRRGTPPAVVEISPTDWIRLATGRITWADAADDGTVRASGVRSDLSPYLPLLS